MNRAGYNFGGICKELAACYRFGRKLHLAWAISRDQKKAAEENKMTQEKSAVSNTAKSFRIGTAILPTMLVVIVGAATTVACAQKQVFVPGYASGYFGNPADITRPLVPAIEVRGPATIKVSYVSGTLFDGGVIDTGPNGVPWNNAGAQTPLQEADGVADGTVDNIDSLIGAFVPVQRVEDCGKFKAIDGTKNATPVGIVPSWLFFIGEGKTFDVEYAGTLFLGINDYIVSDNSGGFTVEVTATEHGYDPAAQFSATSNPNGTWSYGWSQSRGSAFNLDTEHLLDFGLDAWHSNCCGNDPFLGVYYNQTGVINHGNGSVNIPPGAINMHPGPEGQNSVVRWTAPANGQYAVKVTFSGLDFEGPTTTDVAVLHNDTQLYSSNVDGSGPSSDQFYSGTVSVLAGGTIDFTVGYGTDGNYGFDSTRLEATITPMD